MPDYNDLKKNEIEFQNKKYSKRSLNKDLFVLTVKEYENSFLTPKHLNGHSRGLLRKRAVGEILKYGIKGKRILDFCCGGGELGVYLAKKGAIVSGFDISPKAIELSKIRARANTLDINYEVMDAEHLNYSDNYFDFVIGFDALHHVILYPKVPFELSRVVRSGGKIVFAENWGGTNILFQSWRLMTTLKKNKSKERGEVILSRDLLLNHMEKYFNSIRVNPLSLLYMSKKYIHNRFILKEILFLDSILMKIAPFIKNYCGEAVITLTK